VRPDFFTFGRTWTQPSFVICRELVPQSKILFCDLGKILHLESQAFLWWVRFDFPKNEIPLSSRAGSQLFFYVLNGGLKIMCLEPDEYMKMFNITKNLSTEKLHKLDRYWKDNVENTAEEQLHSIVEVVLKERGEKTLEMKRQEQIKELKKSLKVSNPVGRFVSGVKCFFIRSSKAA